jgi:hypothetical protein
MPLNQVTFDDAAHGHDQEGDAHDANEHVERERHPMRPLKQEARAGRGLGVAVAPGRPDAEYGQNRPAGSIDEPGPA